MASLTYSADALQALPAFHKAKWVVLVEGPDDVAFWSAVFRRCGVHGVFVKPVGGSPELDKCVEAVVEREGQVAIARDRDYRGLCSQLESHPRVLWTHGYSIENTLYAPDYLAALIATLGRVNEEDAMAVQEWLEGLIADVWECVVLDVANVCARGPVKVLGDNSASFLRPRGSCRVDHSREEAVRARAEAAIAPRHIRAARRRLDAESRPEWLVVRGKFLTHAVCRYVKSRASRLRGGRVDVTNEHLFSSAVAIMEARWGTRLDVAWLQGETAKLSAAG